MPVLDVGGIQLDYERSGSGWPLLMIMGMAGSSLHWGEPFLEPLRRDFEVIVFDNRGVGASSRLEGEITIRQMAADALGLLDALEVPAAHVMGISMGGMIAQELALAQPARVRTLTLGCTYCGGEGSAHTSAAVAARLARARESGDRERALRAAWEANVSPAMAADAEAWKRFLQISHRRAVAVPVILAQMRAILGHDTSGRLGELQMPVLVVHGSADEILPVQNGRQVASLIPGSQLEIFDGVGHLFFWERPQRSAELVRELAAVPV